VDETAGAFAMVESLGAELLPKPPSEPTIDLAALAMASGEVPAEADADGADAADAADEVTTGRSDHCPEYKLRAAQAQYETQGGTEGGSRNTEIAAIEDEVAMAEALLQKAIGRRDFEEAARIQKKIDSCKDQITAILLNDTMALQRQFDASVERPSDGLTDEHPLASVGRDASRGYGSNPSKDGLMDGTEAELTDDVEAAFQAGRSRLKSVEGIVRLERAGRLALELDELVEMGDEMEMVGQVAKELAKQVAKEVVEEEAEELVAEAVEGAGMDNGIDEDVLSEVTDSPACLNIAFNLYSRLAPSSSTLVGDSAPVGEQVGEQEDDGEVTLMIALDRAPISGAGFSICAWFDFCCRCLRRTLVGGAGRGVLYSDLVQVFRSASGSGSGHASGHGGRRSSNSSVNSDDLEESISLHTEALSFVQFKIALRHLAVLTSRRPDGRGLTDGNGGDASVQREEDLESWFGGFASLSHDDSIANRSSLALARAQARAQLIDLLSELVRRMPIVAVHARSLLQRPLPSPCFYSAAVMSVIRRHEKALDYHFSAASVLSPAGSTNDDNNHRAAGEAEASTASSSSRGRGMVKEGGVGYAALVTLLREARLLRPLAGEERVVDRCFKCACRPYRWSEEKSREGRGSTWTTPKRPKRRVKKELPERTQGAEKGAEMGRENETIHAAAGDDGNMAGSGKNTADVDLDAVFGKSRWERSVEQAHVEAVRLCKAEFVECLLRCALLLPIVGTMTAAPTSPSRSSSRSSRASWPTLDRSTDRPTLDRSNVSVSSQWDDDAGEGVPSSINGTIMTCRRVEALLKALTQLTEYKQSPAKGGAGRGVGGQAPEHSNGGASATQSSGSSGAASISREQVCAATAGTEPRSRRAARPSVPAAPPASTAAAAASTAASVVFECYENTLLRLFQTHSVRSMADAHAAGGVYAARVPLHTSDPRPTTKPSAAASARFSIEGAQYRMELEGFMRFVGVFKVFSEGWIDERAILRIFRARAMQTPQKDTSDGADRAETRLLQLRYSEFVECLDAIAGRMFSGAAFQSEYPTARDKVCLLLFKMDESEPGMFEGIGSMLALRHCAPL
jgi:hypothetical protein